MLMSVSDLKAYITTSESDSVLEARLQALELLIRKHTNNNFQVRKIRTYADVTTSMVYCDTTYFSIGDTIQISDSNTNDGLYTVKEKDDDHLVLDRAMFPDLNVLVTKVFYPMDIKMGAVNMLKWDLENRAKVGIQSESISRHSVTYFNMDGDNSSLGYPKSLTGFMTPYMKARF